VPSTTRHPWVTWRAHAWWAALILLPFLVPHAFMAAGNNGHVVGSLVVYGPFIAAMWISGHVVLNTLQRDRPTRSPLIAT
jgi:hypothetical protein